MGVKECAFCHRMLGYGMFYLCKKGTNQLSSYCKECSNFNSKLNRRIKNGQQT